MDGNSGHNQVSGTNSSDNLSGTNSSDILNGMAGDDILDGGSGADVYNGGAGNDRYVLGDTDAIETLQFNNTGTEQDTLDISNLLPDSGVNASNLKQFVKINTNGVFVDASGSGQFSTENQVARFAAGNPPLNAMVAVQVADTSVIHFDWTETANIPLVDAEISTSLGSSNSQSKIMGTYQADNLQGTSGDDALYGKWGDDVLNGGAGADIYVGGAGSDRYVLADTDAVDTLDFQSTRHQKDVLDVSQLLPSGVTAENIGNFLKITEEAVYFDADGEGNFIEGDKIAEFTDNSIFSRDQINVQLAPGTKILFDVVSTAGVQFEAGESFETTQSLSQKLHKYQLSDEIQGATESHDANAETGFIRSGKGKKFNLDLQNFGLKEAHGGEGDEQLDASSIATQGDQSESEADHKVKLYGRDGSDTLIGGEDGGFLDGGAGNDRIQSGLGRNLLAGGEGEDEFALSFEASTDSIKSDKLYDFSSQEGHRDLLDLQGVLPAEANAGNIHSYVKVTDGGVFVDLNGNAHFSEETQLARFGEKVDIDNLINLRLNDGSNIQIDRDDALSTVHGDAGSNKIKSGDGTDYLYGNEGDDTLDGDALASTSSADHLYGGEGNDKLRIDKLDITEGTVDGGAGYDEAKISASAGDSVTFDMHASGIEKAWGSDSDDVIDGSGFTDTSGGYNKSSGDYETSEAQRLDLYGRDGDDTLLAGVGRDYLDGGSGDDVISGGLGRDFLNGGAGDDVFVLADDNELDALWDYKSDETQHDIIDIDAFVANDFDYTQITNYFNVDTSYVYFDPTGGGNFTYSEAIAKMGGKVNLEDPVNVRFNGIQITLDLDTGDISVVSINAPTSSDQTVTGLEDSDYTFTTSDFAFADLDPNDVLTQIKIDTLPASGALTLNGTAIAAGTAIALSDISAGNFKFIPVADANGDSYDSFTFNVGDTAAIFSVDANTMTVNITPQNDAPVLVSNIASESVAEDAVLSFQVPENTFTDIDGDSLSYSASLADGTVLPDWLVFDAGSRTFKGAPDNEDVSTLNLKVTATDPDGETAEALFNLDVTNVNDGPIQVFQESEGLVSIEAEHFHSSVGRDGSSWSAVADVGASGGESVSTSTNGMWRTGDATEGSSPELTYEINFDSPGTYYVWMKGETTSGGGDSLHIGVNGEYNHTPYGFTGFGHSASWTSSGHATITVPTAGPQQINLWLREHGLSVDKIVLTKDSNYTPSGEGPAESSYYNAPADQVATDESAFSYTIAADAFVDPDAGDNLTLSATLSDGSPLPSWLNFDADTRTFSGTPDDADLGNLVVKVTASDGELTHSDEFNLTVNNFNDTPDSVALDSTSVSENSAGAVVGTLTTTDEDVGDAHTYSVSDNRFEVVDDQLKLQDNVSLDMESEGSINITVTATDSGGATVDQAFTLTVLDTNDAPELASHSLIEEVVAAYSFDDSSDATGNGNSLTLSGSATTGTGYDGSGSALEMNGTAGAADISGLQTGGEMSVSSWVRFDSFDESWSRLFDFGDGEANNNILIGHVGTSNSLGFHIYQGEGSSADASLEINDFFTAGEWVHIAATISADGTMSVYKNGELAGQAQGVVPSETVRANNYIGKSHWDDGYLDGAVGEFAVYEKALSASEAKAVYETGTVENQLNDAIHVIENSSDATVIATVAGSDQDTGDTLTYTLTDDASGRFAINNSGEVSVANGVLLDHESNDSHTITVNVSDGEFTDTRSYTVYVIDNNEAPTAANETVSTDEDNSYAFTTDDFNFTDQDQSDSLSEIKVESLPVEGQLLLNGVAVSVSDAVSVADIQAGLLTFEPVSDASGNNYASFTFKVADADGELSESAYSMTVNVDAVNDVPVISAAITSTINEDSSVTFTKSQLLANASDVDADTLSVSNVRIGSGSASVTDNGDDSWTVTPDGQWSGTSQLDFDISDGSETVTSQVNITVNAVADSPLLSISESSVISSMNFNAGLADGWTSDHTLETHASGGPLGASDSGTSIAELDAGNGADAYYYSVDTSQGQDHEISLWVKQRDGYDGTDGIEVVWDGEVIQTIDPGSSWQEVIVSLPDTGQANTQLSVRELASQNDGVGPLLDQISITRIGADDSTDPAYDKSISSTEDTRIALDLSASLADSDGSETLSVSLGGIPSGFALSDGSSSVTTDGSAVDVSGWDLANITLIPVANHETDFTLTLSATATESANSDVATVTQSIRVDIQPVQDAASISGDDSGTVAEDAAATLTVSGSLSVTDADAGDASFTAETVTGSYGSVTIDADGNWTYSADNSQTAIQALGASETLTDTLSVRSVDGTAQTITVTLQGTDDAPVVSNVDLGSVNEDNSVVITEAQLLANSSDIDGDSLSVSSVSLNDPAHGALTDNGNNTWTFSPTANFNGTDIGFSFTVSDGSSGDETSATAVVDVVAVDDDAVVENAVANQSVNEDSAFSFIVPENTFSHGDGDSLTYSASMTDGSVLPEWLNFDAATRTFSGTPDNEDVATLGLRVTASDEDGETTDASFNLVVNNVNDAPSPVFAEDDGLISIEAEHFSSNVGRSGNSWTVENDAGASGGQQVNTANNDNDGFDTDYTGVSSELTYDIQFDSAGTYYVWVRGEAPGGRSDSAHIGLNGEAVSTGARILFNQGSYDWNGNRMDSAGRVTIEVDAPGTHQLNLWMREDGAAVDKIVISDDVNYAPTGSGPAESSYVGITDQTTAEEAAFSYTIDANAFNDIDGDGLTYSATLSDGDPLPSWMSFDSATRTFSGTPDDPDVGTVQVRVTASDGSLSSSVDVSITVTGVNDAPQAPAAVVEQIDVVWGGATISDKAAASYELPDGFQLGDSIWLTKTDGGYSKGVKVQISDNGDGTLNALVIEAKYTDLDIWNGLSTEQKTTYFENAGTDQQVATSNSVTGYGISEISINGGPIASGFLDTSTGKNVDPFATVENSSNSTSIGSVASSDADGDSLTYTLTNDAGGRFTINSSTGEITVADGSLLDYESATSHTVSVQVSDGYLSDSRDYTVYVTNANDVPDSTDATVSTGEDAALTLAAANFAFNDEDASDALAAVVISTLPAEGSLTLNGAAVSANQSISKADLDAGLLVYTPASDASGDARANFNFKVSDGSALSVSDYTITINVTPDADAPTISIADSANISSMNFNAGLADGWTSDHTLETHASGGPLGTSNSGTSIAELDAGNGVDAYYYSVDTSQGQDHEISLWVKQRDGYDGTDGIEVVWDGEVIQTIDPGNSWQEVIVSLPDTGQANTQLSVRELASQNDGVGPLLDQISITRIGADDSTDPAYDKSISSTEDTRIALDLSASLADSDGSETLSVSLGGIPSGFALSDGSSSVTTDGSAVDVSGWDLANITLIPVANHETDFILTLSATATESSGGDTSTSTQSIAVNVVPVNDGPTGADATFTFNEDGSRTLAASDFGFSDIDTGDSLQQVQISTLPNDGTLKLNGVDVTEDQVISKADIDAGLLVFAPDSNEAGTNYATFGFKVHDGTEYSAEENTLTFDVTALADAPVMNDISTQILNSNFNGGNTDGWQEHNPTSSSSSAFQNNQLYNWQSREVYRDIDTSDSSVQTYEITFTLHHDKSLYHTSNIWVKWGGQNVATYTESAGSGTVTSTKTILVSATGDPTTQLRFDQDTNYFRLDDIKINKVIETDEDSALALPDLGIDLVDTDGSETLAVTAGGVPAGAVLTDGVNSTTADGSDVDISGWDYAGLQITPPQDSTDTIDLTFTATTTDTGGVTATTSGSMSIRVNEVSDKPVSEDNTLALKQSDDYTFSSSDFSFTDADSGDSLQSITITSLPASGSLTLNGAAVTADQVITAADIAYLKYTAPATDPDVGTSFGFTVSDGSLSSDPQAFNVNVRGTYSDNLLTNAGAENGTSGWNIIENGGSGWGTESTSHDGDGKSWGTSYAWDKKSQTVDLLAKGFTAEALDAAPDISVSDWYKDDHNNDSYYLKVELRDADNNVIESFNTGTLTATDNWNEAANVFDDYGPGVRYVYFEHGGKSSEFWGGQYGAHIDDSEVVVKVGDVELVGTGADEIIDGTDQADTIKGESGSDTLLGDAGTDMIFGGDGDDTIKGDNGSGTISVELDSAFVTAASQVTLPAATGLKAEVFDTSTNFSHLDQAIDLINNSDQAKATFTASSFDYHSSGDNLGGFLGSDSSSLTGNSDMSDQTFAMKMTGYIRLSAGTHDFNVASDDGFRLKINGDTVTEFTAPRGVATSSGNFTAPQDGLYEVELIYWQGSGGADLDFTSSSAEPFQLYDMLPAGVEQVSGQNYYDLPTPDITVDVASGVALSAGTNNGDGTWSLKGSDLSGLTMTNTGVNAWDDSLTFTASKQTNRSVAIGDSSFENQSLADGAWQNSPASGGSWTFSGASGLEDYSATSFDEQAAEGTDSAFIDSAGGTISQQLSETFNRDTIYELKVDIGNRKDFSGFNLDYDVRITAGGVELASDNSIIPAEGQFETLTLTLDGNSIAANSPAVGQPITIELFSSGGGQIQFDYVRMTATTTEQVAEETVNTDQSDQITGGAGDDILSGGNDSDMFIWNAEDLGTAENPAEDTITDFSAGSGGDVIDLSDVLVDESEPLENYLSLNFDNGDTTIEVKPAGTDVTQTIKLEGVDLSAYGGGSTDSEILNNLISDGNLQID